MSHVTSLFRSFLAASAIGAAVLAVLASPARAAPITVGSQAFADIGSATASPTGNINTATSFTLGNLLSTGGQTGVFSGMTTQIFGAVPFDILVPNSLSFTTATFGTFLSTSFTEQSNVSGSRSFLVLGTYTAGTYVGSTNPSPADASLTISFTQTPAATGSISSSATLSIPPVAVPEPSTIMLASIGIGGVIVLDAQRRKRIRRQLA